MHAFAGFYLPTPKKEYETYIHDIRYASIPPFPLKNKII
jgi:hypothetical protein